MDASLLRDIPLLARLDEQELARLAALLKDRSFAANQPIFWIGDKGDELFIIRSGRAQVSYPDAAGNEVVLAELGPGAFFGDVALLDGGARTASVRTIEAAEMLSLSRADFLGFLRQNPEAAIDVLTTVGMRQRETLEKLRGVTNANVVIEQKATTWQKIADFIAELSASRGFVVFHAIFFVAYMVWNAIPWKVAFDPFPYNFLTMTVSLEAIFLSIFVLISQNRSGEKDRIRADADYQVNLKAQFEIMQLHAKIDRLTEIVEKQQPSR
jgi:uncharacterized membrane protein